MIAKNALQTKGMQDNLLPLFIMREGGVIVNDKPKIHYEDATTLDHCLSFPSYGLMISLQLNGIFSSFETRMLTLHELEHYDKVFITPDSSEWNPNCSSFAENEE